MVTTLIVQIVRFARPNIQIYDARVVDLYQSVCAQYLVGAKGAETKAKRSQARLSTEFQNGSRWCRRPLLTRKYLQVIGARVFPEPQKKQRVGGGGRSRVRTGLGEHTLLFAVLENFFRERARGFLPKVATSACFCYRIRDTIAGKRDWRNH